MDTYTGRARADRRKLRKERREKRKAATIDHGRRLGQKAPEVIRHQTTDQHGEATFGGVSVGGDNALRAAAALSPYVAENGRGEADSERPYRGTLYTGEPWMGLEPSQILCDVERLEEGILIAVGALERAVDRLAIVRQIAMDAMEA